MVSILQHFLIFANYFPPENIETAPKVLGRFLILSSLLVALLQETKPT